MNPTNYEVFVYGFYFALGGAASGALVAMGLGIFSGVAGAVVSHFTKDDEEGE